MLACFKIYGLKWQQHWTVSQGYRSRTMVTIMEKKLLEQWYTKRVFREQNFEKSYMVQNCDSLLQLRRQKSSRFALISMAFPRINNRCLSASCRYYSIVEDPSFLISLSPICVFLRIRKKSKLKHRKEREVYQ